MVKPDRPALSASGLTTWGQWLHDAAVVQLFDADGNVAIPLADTLPAGGTADQVLTKLSATEGDASWGAPVGEKGDAGLSWEGTWDVLVVYAANDAVAHSDESWIATEATLAGDEPGVSAKWDLLAKSADVGSHAAQHQNGGGDEVNVAGLSGELADPQPPKVHEHDAAYAPTAHAGVVVYKTADQTLASETFEALTFDVEDHDTDGFHDNATNNTRLTVPAGKAGYYRVWAQVAFDTSAGGTQRQLRLYKNAASPYTNTGMIARENAPNAGNLRQISYPAIYLDEGDYVEVVAYQDTGGTLNVAGSGLFETAFGFTRIGS